MIDPSQCPEWSPIIQKQSVNLLTINLINNFNTINPLATENDSDLSGNTFQAICLRKVIIGWAQIDCWSGCDRQQNQIMQNQKGLL